MAEEIILVEGEEKANQLFPLGKIHLFKIGQKRVAVVKTSTGYFGFDNACPHLGHPLSQGHVNFRNEIVCPWHNMMFDLHRGEEIQQRCQNLKTFQICINDKNQLVLKMDA
jgi:nitrite reductase/ring-hydroxylating ferredoxin subunit